ncbi:MAG TPA: hypothetical protein VNM90_25485 [Haliangium sp.]|nr:hypothetical protein [Haliangium sp.]
MSADLDDLLDPARLAALWSKPIARAAASPGRVQGQRPAPINVHAHLRDLVRAIDDELGAHFDPTSPPRRALDAHIELLRARLAPEGATAAASSGNAAAAAAEVLPLLDQLEDLLEALLRAGPWNA